MLIGQFWEPAQRKEFRPPFADVKTVNRHAEKKENTSESDPVFA